MRVEWRGGRIGGGHVGRSVVWKRVEGSGWGCR